MMRVRHHTRKETNARAVPLDAAGHRRSPATMPAYHRGRAPRNKCLHYPADPPTVDEIVAVMRAAGDGPDGARLRALIVILWRAGLRIGEALALTEAGPPRVGAHQHQRPWDLGMPAEQLKR